MSMLRNKFSLSRYVPRRTCFFPFVFYIFLYPSSEIWRIYFQKGGPMDLEKVHGRAHPTSTNGQPPSKLISRVAQRAKRVVSCVPTCTNGQERSYPAQSPLYLMKTKMQHIKKVYFFHKLFKNTIFTMYEWWRFQRYCICLKMFEIRIGIENFNFSLVRIVRSIQSTPLGTVRGYERS